MFDGLRGCLDTVEESTGVVIGPAYSHSQVRCLINVELRLAAHDALNPRGAGLGLFLGFRV